MNLLGWRNPLSFKIILVFIIIFNGCLQETRPSSRAWMDVELTDAATNETFKIGAFRGKPVLLESFAVWCPTCTEQQRQTKELVKREGNRIVHISLDTDPNENVDIVRRHIESNGFDWLYAISPIELTEALIDEFGLKVVNAPGVPMILICPDQNTRFLKSGIKTAEDLLSEVERGC